LESTKVLAIMERFPAGHFLSVEAERRTEARQSSYLRLFVSGFAIEDAKQFASQHGAHAGAPLRGENPRSLEEAPSDGEGDVLLHGRGGARRVPWGKPWDSQFPASRA
jgi:hypothetical protein